MAVVGVGGAVPLGQLGLDPGAYGLILAAWSGVGGIAAFAAAVLLRIRSLDAFGVRRTSWRWLLIGIGVGVVASVVEVLATVAWIGITGDSSTPQTLYAEGADGVSSGDDYLGVFPYLASPKDPDPNLPPLVPREDG